MSRLWFALIHLMGANYESRALNWGLFVGVKILLNYPGGCSAHAVYIFHKYFFIYLA